MKTTLTDPSETTTQATQWTPADVVAAVRATPKAAAAKFLAETAVQPGKE